MSETKVHMTGKEGSNCSEQDNDSIFCCRLVWRFAIRAVLQDLGEHRRWLTLSDLVKRRQLRLKYQQLYLKRLEKSSNGSEAAEVHPLHLPGLCHAEHTNPVLCL